MTRGFLASRGDCEPNYNIRRGRFSATGLWLLGDGSPRLRVYHRSSFYISECFKCYE